MAQIAARRTICLLVCLPVATLNVSGVLAEQIHHAFGPLGQAVTPHPGSPRVDSHEHGPVRERFLNPFSRRSNVIGDVLIPTSMGRNPREQINVIGGVLVPASVACDSREQSKMI